MVIGYVALARRAAIVAAGRTAHTRHARVAPSLLCVRTSARTGSARAFASNSAASSDASYDALKTDFRRWLAKEVQVLSALFVLGVTGIYFYKNRESAPSNKVLQLLARAEQCAKRGDRAEALKLCQQALAITKATNPRDRHLFELTFAIAAQYETLGQPTRALALYHEALTVLPYALDAPQRVASRVVTLDRIAQSYQDKGEQEPAERFYREAIATYDRAQIADTAAAAATTADADAAIAPVDREIPAVLYNYGQQLLHLARYDDAHTQLTRALELAHTADVEGDRVAQIERLLADVAARRAVLDSSSIDIDETENDGDVGDNSSSDVSSM